MTDFYSPVMLIVKLDALFNEIKLSSFRIFIIFMFTNHHAGFILVKMKLDTKTREKKFKTTNVKKQK